MIDCKKNIQIDLNEKIDKIEKNNIKVINLINAIYTR